MQLICHLLIRAILKFAEIPLHYKGKIVGPIEGGEGRAKYVESNPQM